VASLIKTSRGKAPSRAIQFTDQNGDRKTVRLGKIGLETARTFKTKVETLFSCAITNTAPDVQTSTWLADLPDATHAKLAGIGLVEPRTPPPTAPMLKACLDKYIGQREHELKPAGIAKLERTGEFLKEFFGEGLPIDGITEDGAYDWRAWLRSGKKINDATAGTHVRNAKQIFGNAVKRKLIARHPFAELIGPVIAADRDHDATLDEADRILDACPNVHWRTLFALGRFAGLRVPSETHILTWADVDWDRGRLSVYSPKTERYEKHRRRTARIVPKLLTVLQDAFDAVAVGQERVIPLSRNNFCTGRCRRSSPEPGSPPGPSASRRSAGPATQISSRPSRPTPLMCGSDTAGKCRKNTS
jgi:integrase